MIQRLGAKRLFAKPYNFTYLNDQAWRKRLTHERLRVTEDSPLRDRRLADARIPHGVQPLVIVRDGQSWLPHDDFILRPGDEIRVLTRPERVQEGQPLILPPAENHTIPESHA